MMPDVSVVIPTYERAGTIERSVASVLADAEVDVEVLVVDDGSTDDTVARLGRLADRRVRVLERAHEGIAAARNAGVAAATAPIVGFHDSDDEALPGRLSRPVAYLRAHPDVDFVVQNGRMLPASGTSSPPVPWIAPEVARRLAASPLGVREVFAWNLGQLQGMCFTRRALDTVGPFDGGFRILDDLDLVLRVAACFRGAFLDATAFAYRTHAGGVSRDRDAVRLEAIGVGEKLGREYPDAVRAIGARAYRRRQARRWARLAEVAARRGDVPTARDALRSARALAPLSLAYRLSAARLWWRR